MPSDWPQPSTAPATASEGPLAGSQSGAVAKAIDSGGGPRRARLDTIRRAVEAAGREWTRAVEAAGREWTRAVEAAGHEWTREAAESVLAGAGIGWTRLTGLRRTGDVIWPYRGDVIWPRRSGGEGGVSSLKTFKRGSSKGERTTAEKRSKIGQISPIMVK